MTYSYLLDEAESIFHHHVLSPHIRVESGLGLRPHTELRLNLSVGLRLLERLGQRISSGVFTRQVAHFTHRTGLGV